MRCNSRDHVSPVLASLLWLPVKFRIEFKILLFTFKAINDQPPSYLKMYLMMHVKILWCDIFPIELLFELPLRLQVYLSVSICCPDTELLAVGLRPYYLQREFSDVIMVAVYVANLTAASDVIHSTVACLQTQHLSAVIAISYFYILFLLMLFKWVQLYRKNFSGDQ